MIPIMGHGFSRMLRINLARPSRRNQLASHSVPRFLRALRCLAGGVLSAAGGLVFFGDDSGAFAAADAKTGKTLWHFNTNQIWKASPMTYAVEGKQYVAVAVGSNILAFGLP